MQQQHNKDNMLLEMCICRGQPPPPLLFTLQLMEELQKVQNIRYYHMSLILYANTFVNEICFGNEIS